MAHFSSLLRWSLLPLLLAPLAAYSQETWTQDFESINPANPYNYTKSGSGQSFSTANGAGYVAGGTGSYGAHNNTGTGPVVANLDFTPATFNADGSTYYAFRLAVFETNGNGGLNVTQGSVQVNIGYNGGALVPTLRIAGTASEPTWPFSATGTATVTVNTTSPTLTTFNAIAGSGGYSTVRVNFGSAIFRARVQLVLSAPDKTDVVIDNVIMSSAGPLPVELTSFKGYSQTSGVWLQWATASERSCERFEVQRKGEGADFTTIGRVAGHGTTATSNTYAFADSRPLTGTAYYRLRQVDTDGRSSFSPVVAVRWKQEGIAAIYPNPTTGLVLLQPTAAPQRFRVFNAQGQTLLSGETSRQLDLSALPAGSYLLELKDGASSSVQRVLRQ